MSYWATLRANGKKKEGWRAKAVSRLYEWRMGRDLNVSKVAAQRWVVWAMNEVDHNAFDSKADCEKISMRSRVNDEGRIIIWSRRLPIRMQDGLQCPGERAYESTMRNKYSRNNRIYSTFQHINFLHLFHTHGAHWVSASNGNFRNLLSLLQWSMSASLAIK